MSKSYSICLQAPVAEVPIVSAKDIEGRTSEFIGIFKRYGSAMADKKLQEFAEIGGRVFIPAPGPLVVGTETLVSLNVPNSEEKAEEIAFHQKQEEDLKTFLRREFIAVKNFPYQSYDTTTGEIIDEVLEDSRTAPDFPEFWGEGKNCSSFLINLILDSNPFASAIPEAFYRVSYNRTFEKELDAKN